MCSSTESFWNAVDSWGRANPKPLIRVEGSDGNWPVVRTGRVFSFTHGLAIDFIWEGESEPQPLDLSGCTFRVLVIPTSLEESGIVRRFSLICDEPDDTTTRFVFTELRDFGKPN
jgi:hypothetical protein